MSYDFLLLRGLCREQGHWGGFTDRLLKMDRINSIHALDLPGNGQFHKLTSPLSLKEAAEFVHSHRPPALENSQQVLFAYSMGAMVAIEMVNLYPEAYRGVVLVNTSIGGLASLKQRIRWNSYRDYIKILKARGLEDREKSILSLVSNNSKNHDVVSQEWFQIAKNHPVQPLNALRQLVSAALFRKPAMKPLCPALILASRGDRLVDYRCSENIAEAWQAPIAIHPDAGHEITLDDPEWVVSEVKTWLMSLEA